jgi:hypothetical protein
MNEEYPVGGNPLPIEIQDRLGEFLDWMSEKYTFRNGKTAMYWALSFRIADDLEKEK